MEKPSESYGRIYSTLRFYTSLVGCNIFQENYRINVITVFVGMSIIAYYICSFRTVVQVYKDDWKIILEALCLAFSVFQGAVKLVSALIQRKKLFGTTSLIESLYKEFETKGEGYVIALNRSCRLIRRVGKGMLIFHMVTGAGIVFIPFVFQVFTGERYLMMQFYFPGLDVKTTAGYWATTILHAPFIFAAVFGLYSSDLMTVNLLMQSFSFADIFKLKVEELNKSLRDENQSADSCEVKEMLVDIVKWHQFFLGYTKACNDMFFWVITVMVTTAGVSCLFSLFIILKGNWPGAYPYLITTFYTLYFYCVLGTKIEICNDEFCFLIYNISWYELRVPEQKLVRLMLMQSQKPQILQIANMFPLSVSTALQITKLFYSLFMMMIRVLMDTE